MRAKWCSILRVQEMYRGERSARVLVSIADNLGSRPYEHGGREKEPMKMNLKLVLAVLAGAVMGVLGGMAIHAQQPKTAPGYVVAEVDVHDATEFAKYGAKVPETLAPFNGHYVVRGGKVEAVEGTA